MMSLTFFGETLCKSRAGSTFGAEALRSRVAKQTPKFMEALLQYPRDLIYFMAIVQIVPKWLLP